MKILFIFLVVIVIIYLAKIFFFVIGKIMASANLKKRPDKLINQTEIIEMSTSGNLKILREVVALAMPIYEVWENTSNKDFDRLVADDLRSRINNSKAVLKKHGIQRKVRIYATRVYTDYKGKTQRTWDDGSKIWQANDMNVSALELYYKKYDGTLIASYYYPENTEVRIIKSRRLTPADKKDAYSKDKWGRKKKDSNYYEEQRLIVCPSCGAELPSDDKDPVCSYCGATIHSDYYDWQTESIEFVTGEIRFKGIIRSLADFFSTNIGEGVMYKKKVKGKFPVVRFSANGFRNDIYSELYKESDTGDLIDLQIGTIDILKIVNTEDESKVDIRVPVYRTILLNENKIVRKKEVLKTSFTRTRYPNKFNPKKAVISMERFCPNCGGDFTVDDKGCCVRCGTFLFMDDMHWKRAEP